MLARTKSGIIVRAYEMSNSAMTPIYTVNKYTILYKDTRKNQSIVLFHLSANTILWIKDKENAAKMVKLCYEKMKRKHNSQNQHAETFSYLQIWE